MKNKKNRKKSRRKGETEKWKERKKASLNRKEVKEIPTETRAIEEWSLNHQLLGFSGQL